MKEYTYTGVNDSYGEPIYENDIIETTRELNHMIGFVVKRYDDWFIKDLYRMNSYVKLIPRFSKTEYVNKKLGNIYDDKGTEYLPIIDLDIVKKNEV